MDKSPHVNRHFINFGVLILLLGTLLILIKSSTSQGSDSFNLAITVDLLLTVPLVYFLLIRKSDIPNTTVIPVMILGLVLGSYFLPKENQSFLTIFKTWVLPVIEFSILTFTIFKVRRAIRTYKEMHGLSPDFYSALKSTCYEILPKKLVLPFATEIAVFYYGFINWKRPELAANEFTYHKNSGTPTLFGAFILIIGIETAAFHFLLSRWSMVVAWIFTILSIYTAIQVIGFARSLSKRPITINQNSLLLKYGILNETEIPFPTIESFELSGKSIENETMAKTLSPLGGLEAHNVIIRLNVEQELIGLYGIKKKYKVIAFHIDEPVAFQEKLTLARDNFE